MLATDIVYAGFWRRAVAFVIDSILFSLIITILLGPLYVRASFFSLEGLVTNVFSMLMAVVLWVKYMGTPGKLIMGCQIVDARTFSAISVKQAVIRYLAYYASMLPFMAGFIYIALNKRKQGFHDKLAGTVVVQNSILDMSDESQKTLRQLMSEVR